MYRRSESSTKASSYGESRPDEASTPTLASAVPSANYSSGETMPKETDTEMAARIAKVLRERLSDEEFADLRNLLGDYATDEWLCVELTKLGSSSRP